jgi:mannitol/fructose-specific phosphotransferase system IIA component (Ntr-type)
MPAAAVPPPASGWPLSAVLPAGAVVVFDEPVGKEALLAALLRALGRAAPGLDEGEALRHLLRREEQGSTFLEEGIGLPHARLPRLDRPWAALGVLRRGVAGESGPAAIDAVVLLLCPDRDPGGCLELLGRCARLFGRGALRRRILAADGPADMLAALREAEGEFAAGWKGARA